MIGVGLAIILVAAVALLLFIMAAGKQKTHSLRATDFNPQIVQTKWSEINAQMQTPSGLKNALIEADKLLDYVLRGRGYHGETMADRLKNAQSQIRDRESVWQAHKLRNSMVHDVAIDIVPTQIHGAVRALGQAIKDLGVAL